MRPTLIIDADDTLWENEIFYEQCLEDFEALMVGCGFDRDDVVRTIDSVERERVPLVGYAPKEFARNLVIAYERLCALRGAAASPPVSERAWEIGYRVVDHPIEPFQGVEETLTWLKPRFRLLVLTKGDEDVQESKMVRSGLRPLFDALHVVREKDVRVLRDLIERYALAPDMTWMVGNSPRSDINPALEAGIGAVFIPHANTWDLEQEAIVPSDRVVELTSFSELIDLFAGNEAGER